MTDWILRLSEEIAQQWSDIVWEADLATRRDRIAELIERAYLDSEAKLPIVEPCDCGFWNSDMYHRCRNLCHLCGFPDHGPEHHCP